MANFTVNLAGQVALVTNAGEGIGRAVALALARAGAAICANSMNPDRAERVAAEIEASGGRAMAWTADVSDRFQVAAMIENLRDEFGGLHILINSAGVERREALLKIDEYDWRRVVEINLTGTFFCTQLVSRVMADEGGGVIVNIGQHRRIWGGPPGRRSVCCQPGRDPRPDARGRARPGRARCAGERGVSGQHHRRARASRPGADSPGAHRHAG